MRECAHYCFDLSRRQRYAQKMFLTLIPPNLFSWLFFRPIVWLHASILYKLKRSFESPNSLSVLFDRWFRLQSDEIAYRSYLRLPSFCNYFLGYESLWCYSRWQLFSLIPLFLNCVLLFSSKLVVKLNLIKGSMVPNDEPFSSSALFSYCKYFPTPMVSAEDFDRGTVWFVKL